MDDDNVYTMNQYQKPAWWMEWSAYAGAVLLLSAGITTGNVWFFAALCGMLLYWNYRLFDTMKQYVAYVNTNEFKMLLDRIRDAENKEHKDGTFQCSSCLNKEQDDVETSLEEGD